MSPEIQSEQTPVAQNPQQSGVFEKINNSVRTRLAIAGIALASAIGAAELSRSSEADAAPAPEATASSLKQTCVKIGLTRPNIEVAAIYNAGKTRRQINILGETFKQMPDKCEGKYKRTAVGMFQAKGPGDNKWRSLSGSWRSINNMNTDSAGFYDTPGSHVDAPGAASYIEKNERARVIQKIKVINKRHKIVGEKRFVKPVTVYKGRGPQD